MTQSRARNRTGCGLRMEMWFAEKTCTAMDLQAVVGAKALLHNLDLI